MKEQEQVTVKVFAGLVKSKGDQVLREVSLDTSRFSLH